MTNVVAVRRLATLLLLGWAVPAQAADPPITAAAFAPDGKSVVVGSQAGLEVRSWPNLKPLRKLDTKLAHIHDLAFSPKGDTLAAAGGKPAEEGAVELFHWPKGDLVRRDVAHEDLVYAVAWSADGTQLVTASADRTCQVRDPATGKRLHVFDGHSGPVAAACVMPDGKLVVSASGDQTLRVWEAGTGRQVRSFENHVGAVHALALRPGTPADAPPGVASASADRTVRLWQPTVGRMIRFARLPSAPVSLAWTPDGGRLLAGCADGRLRVIDPDTVKVVGEHEVFKGPAHTLAVPPGGDDVLLGGPAAELRKVPVGK